jgi:hypothetical protein
LVASLHIDVVCLQETMMEVISWVSVLHMLGPDFSDPVYLPSVGASGGIHSLEVLIGFSWKLQD